jgi:Isochorismatase family
MPLSTRCGYVTKSASAPPRALEVLGGRGSHLQGASLSGVELQYRVTLQNGRRARIFTLGGPDGDTRSMTSALVVVDALNDFVSRRGKGWPMLRSVATEEGLVAHLRRAIAAARARDIPVLHAPHRAGTGARPPTRSRRVLPASSTASGGVSTQISCRVAARSLFLRTTFRVPSAARTWISTCVHSTSTRSWRAGCLPTPASSPPCGRASILAIESPS